MTSRGGSHAADSRAWEPALLQDFHLLSLSRFSFALPGSPDPGPKRGFDNPLGAILDPLSLYGLLKLALALIIFAAVFFTSGGRVTVDSLEPTSGRVYASPDCASGGWQQGGGTSGRTIYSLASHSGSPKVYAGLWGDGVFIASSGENYWSPSSLMAPLEIAALAIDPSSPDTTVYAGAMENGVIRSDSSGSIWTATVGLEGQDVWSLAISSTANPTYGYAGAVGGVYTSTDGTNWDLAGGTEIGAEKFYALVVDPGNSQTAYVGTKDRGVHRTTNGGIAWTSRGLDGKTVRSLALHPDDSEIIYAGTESHGIFKSTNGGASWSESGLAGRSVMAVAINPRNPDFVYAGTYGDGVWESYNGGESWHRMSGLSGQVYALTLFTPEGGDDCQMLYAGTTDGVWARTVAPFYTLYLPLINKG